MLDGGRGVRVGCASRRRGGETLMLASFIVPILLLCGAGDGRVSAAASVEQPKEAPIAERLAASTELVALADAVVIGTPVEARSQWSPDHRMIYTSYRIRIDGLVSGKADPILELTAEGGTVDDTSLRVSNFPNLALGEPYLFLVGDLPRYRCILGGARGAFPLPPAGPDAGWSVSQIAATVMEVRKAAAR
jgi:hypothetical protein